MSLKDELNAAYEGFRSKMPEPAAAFDADTQDMAHRGIGAGAPKVGGSAADFELPDQLGRSVRSADLRAKGPLVISFYRGNWCPYCNLELHALKQYQPQMSEFGATLVMISPQLPDESLSAAEKYELTSPVLSDVGNVVARQYGLVFELSEHLRPMYAQFGIDLPKYNGTNTFELPVPGTFVLDRAGVVRAAHANPDYKKRMEPGEIIETLAAL